MLPLLVADYRFRPASRFGSERERTCSGHYTRFNRPRKWTFRTQPATNGGIAMCQTVASLVEQFLAWIETRNRPRTVAYYRSFLSRFAAAVGDVPLADLRRHHLLTWGSSWHQLQSVQRLFNWAHVEMELVDRNP